MYREMGRWREAESLYQQALKVLEKNPGPEHPQMAEALEEYVTLLRKVGRNRVADDMASRAKRIRDKTH